MKKIWYRNSTPETKIDTYRLWCKVAETDTMPDDDGLLVRLILGLLQSHRGVAYYNSDRNTVTVWMNGRLRVNRKEYDAHEFFTNYDL